MFEQHLLTICNGYRSSLVKVRLVRCVTMKQKIYFMCLGISLLQKRLGCRLCLQTSNGKSIIF
ncbi:hypothetical protein Gogos_022164 [Gossypium gossypioides]|uniref:Uncharacterized protein n=1 Tax=Gossypium gossypioides TaxID=34282 RepID=A0A7J9CXF4_GOSGO|nr:hypothetical protein [Gossypium gossypioides]